MSARPRLLFVSPCTPDPLGTGWEQRAFSFLLAYSKIMDVELWFEPTGDKRDLGRARGFAGLCQQWVAYDAAELGRDGSGINVRFGNAVSTADHLHMFRLPFAAKHRSLLWDIDELPPGIRADYSPLPLAEGVTQYSFGQMGKYKAIAPHCRLVFASSELEGHPWLGTVAVMPNVAHPQAAAQRCRKADAPLLFVGNLGHAPNWDGLQFFFGQIAPLLPTTMKLHVVGRAPKAELHRSSLEHRARQGEIDLHFDVESCAPYYAGAFAAIAPIRFGGGTRVKIVEAFAHRCPVVSTSKGCEGLGVSDGRELLVRDDPKAFAKACVELQADAEFANALAGRGHIHFKENNSQEVLERQLFAALAATGIVFTPPLQPS